MITFTVLLIALVILGIAAGAILLLGGTGVIMVFGDLIICGGIIWTLVQLFKRRK